MLFIMFSLALDPLNHSFCHSAIQIGIFSRRLHNPTPSGIPYQIHHRRKGYVESVCRRLSGHYVSCCLCSFRGKGAAQSKGNRENSFISIDDIRHKNYRNVVGLFFHAPFLQSPDFLSSDSSQDTSCQRQLFSGNPLFHSASCHRAFLFKTAYIQLHHLPDFFF